MNHENQKSDPGTLLETRSKNFEKSEHIISIRTEYYFKYMLISIVVNTVRLPGPDESLRLR